MRKKIIIGAVLVLTIGGFFAYNVYRLNKSISVTLVEASEGVIQESVFASGKLEPIEESTLFVPYTGTVDKVEVKPGDRVKAGQTLLVMGTSDWEDQIRLEENNREMIVAELNNYRKQVLEGAKQELQAGKDSSEVLSKDELEVYRLRLERSDMTIEGLRKKLADRELKATMDGIVTAVSVKASQTASEGMTAFTIVNDRELRVKAYLNELDAGKVKQGMEAAITGDAFENVFSGMISFLAPVAAPADQTSRDPSVEIWVDVKDETEQLRPGYNSTIEVVIQEEPHLLLPLSAVKQKGEKTLVYQIAESLAVEKEVKTGKDDGERIEILSGLDAGEKVISELTDGLAAGKKVKPK